MFKKISKLFTKKGPIVKVYKQEIDMHVAIKDHIAIEFEKGVFNKDYTKFSINGKVYASTIVDGISSIYVLTENKWAKLSGLPLNTQG